MEESAAQARAASAAQSQDAGWIRWDGSTVTTTSEDLTAGAACVASGTGTAWADLLYDQSGAMAPMGSMVLVGVTAEGGAVWLDPSAIARVQSASGGAR